MSVSVVIANYNGRHLIDTCLSSLVPQVTDPSMVIVVDNGSTDGSVDYIREVWPMVTGLFLGSNTGFTGANNAGAAITDSDYVVLLNNDTRVAPDWLANLLKPLENSSVGAVTSSMRRMGDKGTMDSAGGGMDNLGYTFDRGRGEPSEKWSTADEVFSPCGGAMALRRSSLEDGKTLFWNTLFLYNEDTDLGLRLWKNGYRVVYEPSAVVEHVMSATAGTASPARIRFCSRNRILVMRRHLGREFDRISILLAAWEVISLGYMLSKGQTGRFRSSLTGLREAFTMKVVPLGNSMTARQLYARFMQPTTGTALRRKMGSMVYDRLSP